MTATAYTERVFNDGVIYSYTPTAAYAVDGATAGLDRVSSPSHSNYPSPTSVGFPSYLEQNGVVRMPSIIMPESPWTSIYDQCCVDTTIRPHLGQLLLVLLLDKGPTDTQVRRRAAALLQQLLPA